MIGLRQNGKNLLVFKRKILVRNNLSEDLKNNRDSPKEQKLRQDKIKKKANPHHFSKIKCFGHLKYSFKHPPPFVCFFLF